MPRNGPVGTLPLNQLGKLGKDRIRDLTTFAVLGGTRFEPDLAHVEVHLAPPKGQDFGYEAGHMMYLHGPSREAVAADIRAFILGG